MNVLLRVLRCEKNVLRYSTIGVGRWFLFYFLELNTGMGVYINGASS
jgi:hypothetical protein